MRVSRNRDECEPYAFRMNKSMKYAFFSEFGGKKITFFSRVFAVFMVLLMFFAHIFFPAWAGWNFIALFVPS